MYNDKPIIIRKKKAPEAHKPKPEDEEKRNVTVEEGKMITQARNKLNLKQEDLAKKCNVTVAVVSKWEKGQDVFDKKIGAKIGKVLGIKFNE
ncbi:multi -bridging factor 1 [Tubulinosema ratisbonensis]|uniref:Multi-bridging factor 1 n=1 Tax=Tubulinosema ratisbonensis TaxID=291195 RepID=A0A437APW0_9MICR|nr:multi -bridging factor 1 [Tubulinosema ratisbonensis]